MGRGIEMMIDYIKLKNYRQYRDQIINLGAGEEGKNIMIIEGTTGAGKTNILNAITWCLYGQEFHISKNYEGLPIANTLVLNELVPNKKTTVEVEIQLISNDKNKRYKIKRTAWIQKSEKGGAEQIIDRYLSNQDDGSKLEVFAQIGKDIKGEFQHPTDTVQRLLPEKINEYFLFDGERLDDYFKEGSGERIKEAVFKISQLELLDRMIDHLDKAKDEFLRSSEGLTPKIKDLEGRKIALQESLERMKTELEKLLNEKKEAKEHRNEINKELMVSSSVKIEKLAEEREELEQGLSKLESDLKEERKNKSDYLIEMSPLILTYEAINRSWLIISKQKEAGKIPPDIAKNFVERLVKKGVCICGTDISKENEYRKNVELFLQSCEDISNISGEITELYGSLRSLIDETSDFHKKQIMYGKRVKDLEEREKKNNERLKRIEEEIKGCDIEKTKRLEEKLEEYDTEISKVDEKIGETKTMIDNSKDVIGVIEGDLKEELKKEKKLQYLSRICSFCDKALETAGKIKIEIMEETRKEIEERTKKQFFDVIWKKVTYKEVKIDDNYNFLVLDQTGRKALGTLSAGERESLALSFMAALNTVSGFDVPIVIDTPLARIDTEPRQDIARSIPEYFKDTQVVLLVTSAEYTSAVRKSLSKNVCKEYKIKFEEHKKGSEAKVVPYEK